MNNLQQLLETGNSVFNHIPVPMVITDKDTNILWWSRQAEKELGYMGDEVIGKRTSFFEPAMKVQYQAMWEELLRSLTPIRIEEFTFEMKESSALTCDLVMKSFTIRDNRYVIILFESINSSPTGISNNIELNSLTKGLNHAFMVSYLDLEGLITYANEEFLQFSKWTPKRILGKSFWQMFTEDEAKREVANRIWDTINSGNLWNGIVEKETRNGESYWVEMSAIPIMFPTGKPMYFILLEKDVTNKILLQKNLEEIAFVDPDTGLMNSHHLEKIVDNLIEDGRNFSFVYLSIDKFYTIKNLEEVDSEKELLVEFKKRLQMYFQDSEIARVGVHDFVAITPLGDWFVQGFIQFLKQHPIYIGNVALPISLSGGITKYPENQTSFSHLMKASQEIIRNVQLNGGGEISSLSKSSHASLNRKIMIEKQLFKALNQQDLQVFYQPKLDVKTNKIVSVEAFVRWHDEVLGVVTPEELIPIAEETGLILDIGAFMLEQACKQASIWARKGLNLKVSINSSVREFRNHNMVKKIREALEITNCPASQLQIEITEKFALEAEAEQSIVRQMKQLQKDGVEFVLDDFGTGYASFRFMQLLPISEVKIDQTFIQSLTGQVKVKQLVNGMIQFGKSMNLKMLAEGVETDEQLELLKSMDIDVIQGYLVSKPMIAEELEELFKKADYPF